MVPIDQNLGFHDQAGERVVLTCTLTNPSSLSQSIKIEYSEVAASETYAGSYQGTKTTAVTGVSLPAATATSIAHYNFGFNKSAPGTTGGDGYSASPYFWIAGAPAQLWITVSEDEGYVTGSCRNFWQGSGTGTPFLPASVSMNGGRPF